MMRYISFEDAIVVSPLQTTEYVSVETLATEPRASLVLIHCRSSAWERQCELSTTRREQSDCRKITADGAATWRRYLI